MNHIARLFIVAGILFLVIGGVLLLLNRIPGIDWGRLPGDVSWQKGNFRVFVPFGTMILVSILLTIILNVIFRLFR